MNMNPIFAFALKTTGEDLEMKHAMKRVIAVVLAAALTLAMSIAASAAAYPQNSQLKRISDTFLYIQTDIHPLTGTGPVAISQGTLTESGETTNIYLVAMHGLEATAIGYSDDFINCILSGGFETTTPYLNNVKKYMNETIPAGSNVVFIGHSLGGMTAQQLAADQEVKDKYNIVYTTCIASPAICPEQQEGKLNRLVEKSDAVQYLSKYTFSDMETKKANRSVEHGKYNIFNAHTHSYEDRTVWGDYDAVGNKGGDAVITIDDTTTKRFSAPLTSAQTGKSTIYFAIPYDGNNFFGVAVAL